MTDNKLCNVAIMAGGMGTRLKSVTGDLPKPMALLNGKPVLEYQIELCKQFGFKKIGLLVHYGYEIIQNYFKDGKSWGVNLTYIVEKKARGTGGALIDALENFEANFLVIYGDTYLDVDLKKMMDYHKNCNSELTLFVHPNDHPFDSDLVEVDDNFQIKNIHPYPHPKNEHLPNLVNAALYVINRNILINTLPLDGKYDLAKHLFPELINKNIKLQAYLSQEYIKDMGTPERIKKVEADIENAIPDKLSLRNKRMAIFLDRDGTINKEVNHLSSPEQLALFDGVPETIRKWNRSGILVILITNQPVIARGELSWEGLKEIHAKLDQELGNMGAYIDHKYICPHHPHSGYPGEVKHLKINCNCRKPSTGLIDLACKELNVDRTSSWFIGDTTSDIKAGKDAGLKTILVETGYAGKDRKYNVNPDFVVSSLQDAEECIRINSNLKSN
jgi:histidinol-phosphate phosphatase family protein